MRMVAVQQTPGPQFPWNECYSSAVSFCFDIETGFTGCVRIVKIPPDTCLLFEEYFYSCCNTRIEFIPVKDPECDCDECCPLEVGQCGEVKVPAGRFRMLLVDCDGNPVIPDPDDILVQVQHQTC